MKEVSEQVLGVLKVISESSQLNTTDESFYLFIEKLKDFPDADAILNKVEKEYKIIKIEKRPNEVRLKQDEIGLFKSEVGSLDAERVFSYIIKLLPNFRSFYLKAYAKSKISIKNLNTKNYYLVYGVMSEIDDVLNLSTSEKISIQPTTTNEFFWKSFGKLEMNLSQIASSKRLALDFLEEVGIIKVTDIIKRSEIDDLTPEEDGNEIYCFLIEVDRPKFDNALDEMNSLKQKHTNTRQNEGAGLVVKSLDSLTTGSQQSLVSSELSYDDEHGKVTYQGKTQKLFEPPTLEGFLMYRVCNADGARINSADIANDFEAKYPEADKEVSTKMLNNTKKRINEKIGKEFNINDVVNYEREQFWLEHRYCSEKSSYHLARSDN